MSVKRHGVDYAALALVAGVAAAAAFAHLSGSPEVRLCRRVFAGLVNGNEAVRAAIEWERLKALGVDVGAAYARLPDEREQQEYQQAFVRSFAEGFQRGGATLRSFTNWRLGEDGTVSVEYPAKQKTLRFRLSATGKQVQEIGWTPS